MANENVNTSISFLFRGLTAEQFALIDAQFKDNEELRVNTTLKIVKNDEARMIGVYTKIDFLQNSTSAFIIVEVSCHFEIIKESWEKIFNPEEKTVTLPKDFATHLAMLTIGSTRGYLLGKIEKHPIYSKFFVPLVNVQDLVKGDVILKP
ncbi:MAG: hypothetical protein J0L54_08290 [Chitinophagales bacterium]|nr:hypothetical protein [Chitinophagales bacterium]